MTYTKGPWSITKLERSGGLFVTDENEASVCDLYFVDYPDGTIIKHINAEANAHLIAAAPDMLEALNNLPARLDRVVKMLHDATPSRDHGEEFLNGLTCEQYLFEEVNKAIAKAEGK